MIVDHLRTQFLGSPLQTSLHQRNVVGPTFLVRGKSISGSPISFLFPRQSQKHHAVFRFPRFTGVNFNFSLKNADSRGQITANCTRETLYKYFIPVWKEGLLLFRCSIFVAVISAAGLLVWYAQLRATSFVENHLLPSVCTILSEYIQREISFGKVRSVSPLGITLHSCSIGPHREEFSCGEVPIMKLHIRPFTSLRRGKIVISAVLSQPSLLVAQKEDFSWLGIPSPSENGHRRHQSTEEGIDYRTKTRRLAREEIATRWARERVEAARKAAEKGYIVPQEHSNISLKDDLKDASGHPMESSRSGLFFSKDNRIQWMDHRSRDTGMEYVLKHADLEKSFGVKIPGSGISIWSRIVPSSLRYFFKRETRKKVTSEAGITSKQRILNRSALAAVAYFQGLDTGKFSKPSSDQGEVFLDKSPKEAGYDGHEVKNSQHNNGNNVMGRLINQFNSQVPSELFSENYEGCIIRTPIETADGRSIADGNPDSPNNIDVLKVENSGSQHPTEGNPNIAQVSDLSSPCQSFPSSTERPISNHDIVLDKSVDNCYVPETVKFNPSTPNGGGSKRLHVEGLHDSGDGLNRFQDPTSNSSEEYGDKHQGSSQMHQSVSIWPSSLKDWLFRSPKVVEKLFADRLAGQIQKLKSSLTVRTEDLAAELADGVSKVHSEGIEKVLPITLDSVSFTGGTLVLLGYGDREPREMVNANGHIKLENYYSRVHVQLSGDCMEWRSALTSERGGQLSADVFVDSVEQKWNANLKITNLFAPLFERILEIPISLSKGRASGEVYICMSTGDSFPNLHGQLDVNGLAFQILDAPSCFSELVASLCFRGQRIFLHNASGWFGDAPLEASGDFGINPEDGEFHVMCQVPCVEVNALMRTFKMRPLLFPLAGSVTAVFNCQGPLDAPLFVGSGIISRKTSQLPSDLSMSSASETISKNKEAGAVAAFDRIPFSHVSANFTFNLDNCVADLYGIRASLLDGGEIRGAGNAWICPEGELDDSAMDVNLSGNLFFDKVLHRYLPDGIQLLPLKIGEVNGEAKLSGSLLKPRFDIKWAAPKAEDSFADARGDIIISHEYIAVTSSSVAFDLDAKVRTTYPDDYWLQKENINFRKTMPLVVEGVDLDVRMRGFEFANLSSFNSFDSPRPLHLKATGKIKFQGEVVKLIRKGDEKLFGCDNDMSDIEKTKHEESSLVGEISLSGIKLNQLILAPQLSGSLCFSHETMKLEATGKPDEILSVEVFGPSWFHADAIVQNRRLISVSLQKGQLKANMCYQPYHSVNLEVRHLPLDELELASLRGTIQKAELQLNFQKRRGHGLLSVLHPKFSGLLGEALDVAARWSGDVITVEKTVLEQASSRYELQGEYVLPGVRDRYTTEKERASLFEKAMAGQLSSVISSMGRWRLRLEVPAAEAAEMLPLARLLSRSTDPAVRSRSKNFFIQSLQSAGFHAESLRDLLEAMQSHYSWSDENIFEDITLPGLAELSGRWHGSLDASGGGNGDTMADFDFQGEDWEWGTYKTQRVLATGSYSNNDGLRFEQLFIQKDNATIHADGTLLVPAASLHFAVLNFPVGLVPPLVQVIESSTADPVHSLRQLLMPIKGILHMEGDLRGSLAKPECDVQLRLLDGAIGGIDLGRAEIVASVTSTSILFNAKFEPVIQSGHVHIQGRVPVTYIQDDSAKGTNKEKDTAGGVIRIPAWLNENERSTDATSEKKVVSYKTEDGWDLQLAEGLKGLNWNLLDTGEVRIDAEIKDGGMSLITALSPYANWLHGYADIALQVRGTVKQPIVDGSASFHRASVSSPVLHKPLTNFGGTVHVKSNRLCITSMESRVSRKGKLFVKGNLPLNASEASPGDKIDLKCEHLEVQAKNVFSGQVDSQVQITGSISQPNLSGMIKLSHGEAYLPHDKGNGVVVNRLPSRRSTFRASGYSRTTASGHVSRFFGSLSTSSHDKLHESVGKQSEVEKEMEPANRKPGLDVRLTDLKLLLGPELRIVYPLILNFAVSGELELNGLTHPKWMKPRGILMFENGDVNLVATQVRLKRDHLNIAKFEPDLGLDPTLDLVLVGSEWQFRIQGRASTWQDNVVVTSTRSVDQDVLSPTEAARVVESQLAASLLEGDGQLAFKKLATATLETLMPRIEGKGEFGQARWRLVYALQIPSLLYVDPTADPLKSLASNISFGTEVEVQLGKRLQASIVRRMKDSEMAMQWTLIYQLTSRLRILFQSTPSSRLLFEYSATAQD